MTTKEVTMCSRCGVLKPINEQCVNCLDWPKLPQPYEDQPGYLPANPSTNPYTPIVPQKITTGTSTATTMTTPEEVRHKQIVGKLDTLAAKIDSLIDFHLPDDYDVETESKSSPAKASPAVELVETSSLARETPLVQALEHILTLTDDVHVPADVALRQIRIYTYATVLSYLRSFIDGS